MSVADCAVAKKLKHRRVVEIKFEFLFGWEKKILSCKLWFKGWLKGLARVYFFCEWVFLSHLIQYPFKFSKEKLSLPSSANAPNPYLYSPS